MRTLKDVLKISMCVLGIALGFLVVMYLVIGWMIAGGIDRTTQNAMAQFNGDQVEALMTLVDCQGCSLEERNHAVWALGEIRDKRALPVLYKYRTGKPCDHSREICQREISKAIRWTEGNSLMLPPVWRVVLGKSHPTAVKTIR